MAGIALASDFAAATRADWLARLGKAPRVTLVEDGVVVEPLYGGGDGPRAWRPFAGPWSVFQRIDHPDPERANAQALEDLANGATGLALAAPDRAPPFARILKDVRIDAVALRLEGGSADRALALAGYIANEPVDPERLTLGFGLGGERLGETAAELRRRHFAGPFADADGRRWHERGASDAQELGFALAEAVSHLRALDTLDGDVLSRAVSVSLAAGSDMFPALAKFRAMRLLWARILEVSGLPAAALALHAETSRRMLSSADPHGNIPRATAAVFAAGLGGASSIAVVPHSASQGLPNGFARRVARNVQTVLIEESNLWRVADPAAGSGYVAHLTRALCERAWMYFQDAEKRGGIAKAGGFIDAQIDGARLKAAGEPRVAHVETMAPDIEVLP